MRSKQTGKTVAKAISYLLVLLVVVGIVGIIVRFTNGFTSDFQTFYVTVDGKDILTSAGGYEMTPKASLEVTVKYAFGAAGGDQKGYSVKVIPNPVRGKDFDFTLDGMAYSYQAERDLTKGFDIENGETSFTVRPKGGLAEILQAVYPNTEIGDCEGKAYEDMFSLVVSSYNGQASVTLNFSVVERVSGITLDKEVIEF